MSNVLEFATEIDGLGSFHVTVLDQNRRVYNLAVALVEAIEQAFNLDVLDEFIELWKVANNGEDGKSGLSEVVDISSDCPKVLYITFGGPEGSAIQNPLCFFEAAINCGEEVGARQIGQTYDEMLVSATVNLFDLGFHDESEPISFSRQTTYAELTATLTGELSEKLSHLDPRETAWLMDAFWQEAEPVMDGLLKALAESVERYPGQGQ